MSNEKMEDFFGAEKMDTTEVIQGEIVLDEEIDKSSTELVPAAVVDDLVLVKPKEVRENYDKSREALEKNLEVGTKLLDNISDNLEDTDPEPKSNNRLYESVGSLIKAMNETAKTLASLHQEAGSILGDAKKIEIDNSHKEINFAPEDMQELVKMINSKKKKE